MSESLETKRPMLLPRNPLDREQTGAHSHQQKPLQRYSHSSPHSRDGARHRQREHGETGGRLTPKAEQRTESHHGLQRKCCNFMKGSANARVPYWYRCEQRRLDSTTSFSTEEYQKLLAHGASAVRGGRRLRTSSSAAGSTRTSATRYSVTFLDDITSGPSLTSYS
jgi:hypothetical protein